jgi:perosamine synthetase
MCGSFGDISTFSFYPNKHITTGEGGMCLTDDDELANRCRKLKNLAFEPDKPRFVHYELGWNYRMTNMQAAVGLAQLENINHHIQKKRWIGHTYNALLPDLIHFTLPLKSTSYAENIYWVYGILAKDETHKNEITSHLRAQKRGSRPFFWCMHEQPVFKKLGLFKGESYPVAEHLARTGFYVPSGLSLVEDEIIRVANTLLSFQQNKP